MSIKHHEIGHENHQRYKFHCKCQVSERNPTAFHQPWPQRLHNPSGVFSANHEAKTCSFAKFEGLMIEGRRILTYLYTPGHSLDQKLWKLRNLHEHVNVLENYQGVVGHSVKMARKLWEPGSETARARCGKVETQHVWKLGLNFFLQPCANGFRTRMSPDAQQVIHPGVV